MFSKPKGKSQEDVSKTDNGYYKDPAMNHGPLRGIFEFKKSKELIVSF